ncbi:hypothetical protein GCM10009105_33330 [Dokdonella soli]|uniref:MFS transporter n=1 Tax=Dokdonella soli TaxID=529810 RepID=A0ABN1IVM2_9GAMM
MNTQHAHPSQTRSFSTIFLIELWERFGYYGMAALLVLFMVQKVGFADTQANLVWGAFTALVYAAPAIGGWVGDKILGTRRTMPIGAAILAIGYLLLAIPSENLYLLYCSMGVIVVGNGLFKANAANMVRRIYEGDDAKIDSAFALYVHGGQCRLDGVGAADAVDQGPLGLACRVRGLLHRPDRRPDQLRVHGANAQGHRFASG